VPKPATGIDIPRRSGDESCRQRNRDIGLHRLAGWRPLRRAGYVAEEETSAGRDRPKPREDCALRLARYPTHDLPRACCVRITTIAAPATGHAERRDRTESEDQQGR